MNSLDELRLRPPITASEMTRIEGPLPTYILVEGYINALAEAALKDDQNIFERLGRKLKIIRSEPKWEGWSGWAAGRKLKCAALECAGWTYDESHWPYEQSAAAYEKIRLVLIGSSSKSPEELLETILKLE